MWSVGSNTLLTEEKRLRMALDAMPHKVWMVQIDGPPIYYNPAMRDFAGSALQLPDRASRERALICPDDLARFLQIRNEGVRSAKDWTIEVRLRCPNGDFRWHRLNFSLLRTDEGPLAYLAVATDIDDLHRALVTAQTSEEQMRLAAEAAQLGVYAFDLQSEEHVWSGELKRILGLDPDQPPPRRVTDVIHPSDRAKFQRARETSLNPTGPGTLRG
jgi:PAS domain S-box-containing protein